MNDPNPILVEISKEMAKEKVFLTVKENIFSAVFSDDSGDKIFLSANEETEIVIKAFVSVAEDLRNRLADEFGNF